MIAAGVLSLLFFALIIGAPVGFAMAVAGSVGLMVIGGTSMPLGVLETAALASVNSYEVITIPMFLLMAELVLASGVADGLFEAAAALFGRVPGGLGMATAIVGAAFGAMCGTSTATAATLSSTSLPAMIKQGYEPRLAAGVVAISGTIAMLVPPSIALIVFGLLAEVNIAKLLVAGIIPAIIVTATIMLTVYVLVKLDPARAPPTAATPWRHKLLLLREVGPMLLLFTCVTGTIYSGIGTPTEASAMGAFGALCIAGARRRLSVRILANAVVRACFGSCMIITILIGANIFGTFFTLVHVTQGVVAWVGSLAVAPTLIIVALLIGYIILGSFMDQIAILVLTVPLVVPLVKSLGYDPIWFGIIKIVTAEVGLITPPIGLNCFIVARYADRPISEVFRGTFPHFIAHLFAIALLVAFPFLTLWLPSRM